MALSHPACTPAALRVTYPTPAPALTVDWGEQVALHIAESITNSVEAADKAAKYLHASAQARSATRTDRSKAQRTAWRHPYDSLLRAASAYADIPKSLFDGVTAGTFDPGNYPVVYHLSVTDADRRAEALLRRHEIYPHITSGRKLAMIADRLLGALELESPGAFSGWIGDSGQSIEVMTNYSTWQEGRMRGLAYLESIGISSEDFERACRRLYEETVVLGRPWLGYTNGVPRVRGVRKDSTPVNPWYLYARTETAEYTGRGGRTLEIGPSATREEVIDYARGGIFHAMEYFMDRRATITGPTKWSSANAATAKAGKLIDSAYAYARQQVQGHLVLKICDHNCQSGAGDVRVGVDRAVLTIVMKDQVPPEGAAQSHLDAFKARYNIWIGEEGLECALNGNDRFGEACDRDYHKFQEFPYQAAVNAWWPTFDISPENAPDRDDDPDYNPYQADEDSAAIPRIYITQEVNGRDELLAGLALPTPKAADGSPLADFQTMRIPISSGLAAALSNTLAVDPLSPGETAQLCGKAGLPRNIKVGLEDELLQAQGVNGSNTVEESWSYYLNLAKSAAEEADMIGSELVDRGIEMDMLAEDARAELEDQCGGTINIGDMRDKVCSAEWKCDLEAFLKDPANAKDESLQQLKQCLGIEEPVDAVLGSNRACTFTMGKLPPCTCPVIDENHKYTVFEGLAAVLAVQSCPGRLLGPGERSDGRTGACPAPLPKGVSASVAACEEVFRPPFFGPATAQDRAPGYKVFPSPVKVKPFGEPLGLVAATEKYEPPTFSCAALASLRGDPASGASLEDVWKWDQKKMLTLASSLGVTRSDANFVTITKGGVPWLWTGKSDPNPWATRDTFPCAPLEGVEADGTPLARYCADSNNDSLLCIRDCRSGSGDEDVSMANGRHEVGERLARAVELLRVLGGAGLKGVEIATYPRLPPEVDPPRDSGGPWWKKVLVDTARQVATLGAAGSLDPPLVAAAFYLHSMRDRDAGYQPWFIKPGQPSPVLVGLNSLKATSASVAFHAACNLPRAMWDGHKDAPECVDRVPGVDDSRHKDWATTPDEFLYDSRFLVTTQKIQDGSVDKVGERASARLVCSDVLGAHSDPFTSSLKWLPPACGDDDASNDTPLADYSTKWLWFMDAGDIQSWPVESQLDLAKFWQKFDGLVADTLFDRSGTIRPTSDAVKVEGHTLGPRSAFIARDWPALTNYSRSELLDALELACVATSGFEEPDCEDPGLIASSSIRGVGDLARAKGILTCRARQIRKTTEVMILPDAPAALVRQMKAGGVANIYPTFGGQYAQTVNELYGALMRISSHLVDLAEEASSAGYALEKVKLNLEAEKYSRRIEVEQAAKEIGALHDRCTIGMTQAAFAMASAAASGAGLNSIYSSGPVAQANVSAAGQLVGAIQTCGALDAEAASARAIKALGGELSRTKIGIVMVDGAAAMVKHQAAVERTLNGLKTAYGDAQAALAKLAAQRVAAYRAAAKMLMLDNSGVGDDFKSNTAMRARLNTLRVRYERARDYAVRMTYLARRSIEQKIGMDLSTLSQDVGWVPAPQTWADTICSLEGIDYKKITDGEEQAKVADKTGQPFDYADQYVGDYVKRLQEFMTAYVNAYVSHDGDDVALVSVRDELLGLRATNCDVEGQNELLQTYLATEGDPLGASESKKQSFEPPAVWERTCDAGGVCVGVTSAADDDDPIVPYGHVEDSTDRPARLTDRDDNQLAFDDDQRVVATDSPSFGLLGDPVRAVRLSAAQGSVGAPTDGIPDGSSLPPTTGVVAWYRADSCSLSASSACEDLSGNGRHSQAATGAVTSIPSGIGGRTHLAFAQGARVVNSQVAPALYTEYTLSTVVRAPSGYGYLWDTSMVLADGRAAKMYLTLNANWIYLSADLRISRDVDSCIAVMWTAA